MAGSRNITTLTLDQKLPQTLRKMQSEAIQFKNAQAIGADSISVSYGFAQIGPVAVAPGASITCIFIISSTITTLTIWNFRWTPFVDALDAAHRWPNGSFFTSSTDKLHDINGFHDDYETNPSTNTQVFKVHIVNNDTVSHNYYVNLTAIRPRGA